MKKLQSISHMEVSLFIFFNPVKIISVFQQLIFYFHIDFILKTLLLRTANGILLGLDKRHVSLLTLLDLSSAFYAIGHNILLCSLNYLYGISGTCLLWFRSYLLSRRQSLGLLTTVCHQKNFIMVFHRALS